MIESLRRPPSPTNKDEYLAVLQRGIEGFKLGEVPDTDCIVFDGIEMQDGDRTEAWASIDDPALFGPTGGGLTIINRTKSFGLFFAKDNALFFTNTDGKLHGGPDTPELRGALEKANYKPSHKARNEPQELISPLITVDEDGVPDQIVDPHLAEKWQRLERHRRHVESTK